MLSGCRQTCLDSTRGLRWQTCLSGSPLGASQLQDVNVHSIRHGGKCLSCDLCPELGRQEMAAYQARGRLVWKKGVCMLVQCNTSYSVHIVHSWCNAYMYAMWENLKPNSRRWPKLPACFALVFSVRRSRHRAAFCVQVLRTRAPYK